ncbi:hypothetical protein FRC10_009448 [Ceratobasidium sp. 414]|nr:hypothetical protein FRC10_009448 [Ceratobasidium sp. 414]
MEVSLDFAACPQSSDRLTRPLDLPSELPVTYESEATYQRYLASGRALNGYDALSDEIGAVCTGGLGNCPPLLLEHLVAIKSSPHFETECAVYQRLKNLQGKDIPTFYGSTQFAGGLSVPGWIRASLGDIDPASIDLDKTINCALRIVDICGDLGVLNKDARFRKKDEDDSEWNIAKARVDEEGCIGYGAVREFKWKCDHNVY